ncbi:MAG: ATP-dependent zinc metalloprotease FtsH [bacterium]
MPEIKNYSLKKEEPEIEINKPNKAPGSAWKNPNNIVWYYLIFVALSFWLWPSYEQAKVTIPYSEFQEYLKNDQVKDVALSENYIRGRLTVEDPNTHEPKAFITTVPKNTRLAEELVKHKAKVVAVKESNWLNNLLFNWIIPFGLLFLLWGWLAKRMGNMSQGFLNIGNKVRIHAEGDIDVTFDDVAGNEEAKEELGETIQFLKDPSVISELGGRMPKGILLMGPPGTGKTLLARAVAGEAKVPFFNISGSEFIEMFVGVGAARVRELFSQAREKAPCIIFIDELDAIGGARGAGSPMGGHDEREQTLNQLLAEMDGFDPSVGVVVMAATNRPETLDKALMRAGRFDRQIAVEKPDLEARAAILKLHTKNMKLASDVDLEVIAQGSPGFVGADLANIANEAAIRAFRHGHRAVTMSDFEEAIDRVIAGPEKKHTGITQKEKHRVAFHESGHTLVAVNVPTGDPVHKVSIIPHGIAALGYTLQLPVQEKFLQTEQELKDQIAVLLGGRVSEEIVFGDVSSGASNDLERASEIARGMVKKLGMSKKLGAITYGKQQQLTYLGVASPEERDYSEETAQLIDDEVKRIVEEQYQRTTEILTSHRSTLDKLASRLEVKEVLSGDEVMEIVGKEAG